MGGCISKDFIACSHLVQLYIWHCCDSPAAFRCSPLMGFHYNPLRQDETFCMHFLVEVLTVNICLHGCKKCSVYGCEHMEWEGAIKHIHQYSLLPTLGPSLGSKTTDASHLLMWSFVIKTHMAFMCDALSPRQTWLICEFSEQPRRLTHQQGNEGQVHMPVGRLFLQHFGCAVTTANPSCTFTKSAEGIFPGLHGTQDPYLCNSSEWRSGHSEVPNKQLVRLCGGVHAMQDLGHVWYLRCVLATYPQQLSLPKWLLLQVTYITV